MAGELARRGGDPSSLDDAVLAWLRARGQQLDVVADVEAYAGDLTARGDEAHLGLSEIPEPEARTLAAGTAAAADELAADAWRLVAQHLQPLGGEDRRARRAARLAAAALERAARAQRIGGGQSPPDDARRLLTAIRLPPPVPPPPERDTSRAAAIRLPPPVPPPPPEDDAAPASPVRVPPPPLGGAPGVRAGANPPVDSLVDSPVNPPSDVPPDVPPEENQPPADLPLGDDGAATLMATAPALSGGLGVTLSPAGLLTVRD